MFQLEVLPPDPELMVGTTEQPSTFSILCRWWEKMKQLCPTSDQSLELHLRKYLSNCKKYLSCSNSLKDFTNSLILPCNTFNAAVSSGLKLINIQFKTWHYTITTCSLVFGSLLLLLLTLNLNPEIRIRDFISLTWDFQDKVNCVSAFCYSTYRIDKL